VTPMVPGWSFEILENPANAEFRHEMCLVLRGPDGAAASFSVPFDSVRAKVLLELQKADRDSFQLQVFAWLKECLGEAAARDITERNQRFLEEALELVQSTGVTREECLRLVDYVYEREKGEVSQEIGGVIVTLSALCTAVGEKMEDCGCAELERCRANGDRIRAKQAAKPRFSPLPGVSSKIVPRTADENTLRFLLAFAYSGEHLYLDDSEIQDNWEQPFIDYRRDSVAEIERKIRTRGKAALDGARCSECGLEQHAPSCSQQR
jgi:hypothetical protein